MDSTELYYRLLKEAQKEKLVINKKTLLKTKKLYEDSINELIGKINNNSFVQGQIEYLEKRIKDIDVTVEDMIKKGITDTSQLATAINGDFFSYVNKKQKLNIDPNILESLYTVNENAIYKIIDGGLYKDKKSLSERIWNYSEKNISNVQDILLKGIIQKKSIKDITDELAAYTGKDNSKVTAIKKQYGNLNANALRLVRTSLNHAFTETMKDECKNNPFIEGYKWILSSAHYERQVKRFGEDICDTYANSNEYNMGIGVYPKNVNRYQHPNCMCIVTAYIPKSSEEIGKELNDWLHNNQEELKWEQAKSKEEALDFAKKITQNNTFKYGDFSIENMNLINEAMYDCYKKIKRPLVNIKSVENMPKDWGSSMQGSYSAKNKLIYMKGGKSKSYLSSLEKSAIRDFSTGFSASDHKLSTLHHEIAHSIYIDLPQETKNKIIEIFEESRRKAYLDWMDVGGSSSKLTQADFHKKILSKYAYKDNDPNEFFAEAFSQIAANKMRPVSRDVFKVLKSSYVGKV